MSEAAGVGNIFLNVEIFQIYLLSLAIPEYLYSDGKNKINKNASLQRRNLDWKILAEILAGGFG